MNLSITSLIKQILFVGLAAYIISELLEINQLITFSVIALLYFADQAVAMYRLIGEDWQEQLDNASKLAQITTNDLQSTSKELAEQKRLTSERAAGYKSDLANFEQTINKQKQLISELEKELSAAKADKQQLDSAKLYAEIENAVENSAMPTSNKTFRWIKSSIAKAIKVSENASANGAGGRTS